MLTWEVTQADVKNYSPSRASRKSRAAVLWIQNCCKSPEEKAQPSLKYLCQEAQLFDCQLSESQLRTQNIVLQLHSALQILPNFGDRQMQ